MMESSQVCCESSMGEGVTAMLSPSSVWHSACCQAPQLSRWHQFSYDLVSELAELTSIFFSSGQLFALFKSLLLLLWILTSLRLLEVCSLGWSYLPRFFDTSVSSMPGCPDSKLERPEVSGKGGRLGNSWLIGLYIIEDNFPAEVTSHWLIWSVDVCDWAVFAH